MSLFSLVPDEPDPRSAEVLGELCESVVLEGFHPSRAARYGRLAFDVARSSAFERSYFYTRPGVERAQRWLDEQPDGVAVVGQLYMRRYLPDERCQAAVLDSCNVEARRVESMAASGSGARRAVALRQVGPVSRYEREVVGELARTWAVSEPERNHFETLAPGRVDLVPNGVDCAQLPARSTVPAEPELLFLGRMDYGANVDGALHLVDEVLPRMRRRDAKLTIVGAGPPRALTSAAERSPVWVSVTGYVSDTRPYLERARLMLVPLRFGAGTRLKILEAMASGVPVVSTTLGYEGLDLEPGRELVVADEPAEMAGWIDRLLEDDDLCRSLAAAGRAAVEARYDWARIGDAADRSLASVSAASASPGVRPRG